MGDRWLTVTPLPDKTILGGPYLWTGSLWQPPEGGGRWAVDMVATGELLEEADALAAGYTWPPPPDEPYVQVDPETMTIVGGPWVWNSTGTPPAEGVLWPEMLALANGYTWA